MADPIVVIGGGMGGLSAAIHLRLAGKRVLLVDQNPTLGGKMREIRQGGFRWDSGPSVVTMRYVFEELFAQAGEKFEDSLSLDPLDPLTRYFFDDGLILDAHLELARMKDQISQIEKRDVAGYEKFLAYAARLYRIVSPVFIFDNPPRLSSILKVPPWDAVRMDGLRTMHQAISAQLVSPQIRQLLGRFATYVGASPFEAPATLNVIAHVELNQGVWYPPDGVYSLARALSGLADRLGVEIRTSSPVQAIELRGDRVAGIRLRGGALLPAHAVVANVDVGTVYTQLLPDRKALVQKKKEYRTHDLSCSGFILLLGVGKTHPQLAHHNIFFSANYRREFTEIFQRGIPPSAPTVYVSISSKSTPSDAPPGKENWFVLVNVPALGEGWDWGGQKLRYRDLVLERLAADGVDIRPFIEEEIILTPKYLEEKTGALRGALYGLSSNHRWSAFRRPHNRDPRVRGLYYAGGSTHPGGGVPMVVLSGKVASRLLLEDGF